MLKEINFYQEMASEHRLQENGRGPVPLYSNSLSLKNYFGSATQIFKFNVI
jgi:hypothetical protein